MHAKEPTGGIMKYSILVKPFLLINTKSVCFKPWSKEEDNAQYDLASTNLKNCLEKLPCSLLLYVPVYTGFYFVCIVPRSREDLSRLQ